MWGDVVRTGRLVDWAEEPTTASASDTFVTAASTSAGADNNTNAVIYVRSMIWLVQEKKGVEDDQGAVIEEENVSTKMEGNGVAQGEDEAATDDVNECDDVFVADVGINGEVDTSESENDVEAAIVDEKDGVEKTSV
jgi:hypothetical protein